METCICHGMSDFVGVFLKASKPISKVGLHCIAGLC